KLTIVVEKSVNPSYNLALEEHLLNEVMPGECILYLWQNDRTVVIGRNQNARYECYMDALEEDNIYLRRRLSGGGAVYHDLGNLNFTFVTRNEDFDIEKQTSIILKAAQSLGFHAMKTGRNDLEIDGRKFSGHAYYRGKQSSYHHGTIMLEVSTVNLSKYLRPSPLKLAARNVNSVVSRVCNLRELKPELSVEEVQQALVDASKDIYSVGTIDYDAVQPSAALVKKYDSHEWNFGVDRNCQYSKEARFNWGLIRIDFSLIEKKGKQYISEIHFASDMLDVGYLEIAQKAVCDKEYSYEKIYDALYARGNEYVSLINGEGTEYAKDIAALLTEGA
ncbi:MAG: lipoate--protein ligase, partial [Eggerthellaceae bacterium]|nr:lipoate--protein ligase [Eggerthellaceae bacterium]